MFTIYLETAIFVLFLSLFYLTLKKNFLLKLNQLIALAALQLLRVRIHESFLLIIILETI